MKYDTFGKNSLYWMRCAVQKQLLFKFVLYHVSKLENKKSYPSHLIYPLRMAHNHRDKQRHILFYLYELHLVSGHTFSNSLLIYAVISFSCILSTVFASTSILVTFALNPTSQFQTSLPFTGRFNLNPIKWKKWASGNPEKYCIKIFG